MNNSSLLQKWSSILNINIVDIKSVAIGIFSDNEKILFANTAMKLFLNLGTNEIPVNKFINPEFKILATNKSDGQIFKGILTLGNRFDISYALNATIYRFNDEILVFAEADLIHLFEENKKMSTLNQQINNLQRELIKEKRNLQYTLNKLKDTQQMLVHSEKMNAMGQLVAGVAHEINNPIGFVYSNLFNWKNIGEDLVSAYISLENLIENTKNTKLLQESKIIREEYDLDYQIKDMSDIFEESKGGIDRVKKIIEDLRTFSRLDESEIKNINLTENLESTISIAKTKFIEKKIGFTFKCPDKLFIDCYPGQLNQAILNILINASQAVKNGGVIKMIIQKQNENIKITIEDNGYGIEQKFKEKIFDPFFTTKPVGMGTGLGLSITHKIICETHNGNIEVESELEKGTKIIISIPKLISR